MIEWIVDGERVAKTHNTKPTLYKNVKVWALLGKYNPASNAKIKKIEYEQKSKYEQILIQAHGLLNQKALTAWRMAY